MVESKLILTDLAIPIGPGDKPAPDIRLRSGKARCTAVNFHVFFFMIYVISDIIYFQLPHVFFWLPCQAKFVILMNYLYKMHALRKNGEVHSLSLVSCFYLRN